MTRAHPDAPVAPQAEPEDPSTDAPPSGAYQGDLAEGLAPPERLSAVPPSEVSEPAAESGTGAVNAPPLPGGSSAGEAPTGSSEGTTSAPEVPAESPEPERAPEEEPAPAAEAAEGAPLATEAAPLAAPAEGAPSAPSAPTPALAAPSAAPAATPTVPPTAKELRSWLTKHRQRTGRALERAEAWCDEFAPARRRN